MSSDLRVKNVCRFSNKHFIAKQYGTKFRSLACAQRSYKQDVRDEKIALTAETVKEQVSKPSPIKTPLPTVEKALIPMKELALVIGISEGTLLRLVKDATFPKIKIGEHLLFPERKSA